MRFLQRYITNLTDRRTWSALLSFALIAVYLADAFQNSTVHEFVHGESIELHSEKNEQDACHQAIYHHSNEECGHKLHISSSDKCSMCHLVFHSEQVLPVNGFKLAERGCDLVRPSFYTLVIDAETSNLSARAPPIA